MSDYVDTINGQGVSLRELLFRTGFRGQGLDNAQAIVTAESGGRADARNVNSDGSVDRGLFQINNKAHPEVSDSCAYDVFCASAAAYRISNRGTNFSAWVTYTTGKYKQFLHSGAIQLVRFSASGGDIVNALHKLPGWNGGQQVGAPLGVGQQGYQSGIAKTGAALDQGVTAAGRIADLLTSADFWIRLGEAMAALLLLVMGLRSLTGTSTTPVTVARAAARRF